MIPALWNVLFSEAGIIVLIWTIVAIAATSWAYREERNAEDLRQMINRSPVVCEVCATYATKRSHPQSGAHLHTMIPAHLVNRVLPGTPEYKGMT